MRAPEVCFPALRTGSDWTWICLDRTQVRNDGVRGCRLPRRVCFERRLPAAPPTFCPVPASPLTVGCSTPGLLTPGGRRRPPAPQVCVTRRRSLPSSSRSRRPRVHPR